MATPDGYRSLLLGSEVEIFKLVSKGASPGQWAEWLRAPLEYAAAEGNSGLVMTLLEAGADVSAGWRGHEGRSLIAAAARSGNEDVVQTLLRAEGNDDINAEFGLRGETALHVAVARGQEGITRALLVAGADPNVTDCEMCGALHKAATEGYHVIVGDLLAHGAHPNIEDNREEAPLHNAARNGHALTVSALLEGGAEKNVANRAGDTPLLLAAVRDELEVAERLLCAGADPNLRTNLYHNHVTPLNGAAACGNLEIVKLLLQHGADAAAVDDDGQTALHHLLDQDEDYEGDYAGVVCALVEAGVPLDVQTFPAQSTALHLASFHSDRPVVLALLQAGSIVNCKDDDGRTPLHWACARANVAVVEVLLRWGADETTVDAEHRTPPDVVGEVSLARCGESYECVRRMLARAPADRAWRRRGWLVLCRYHPDRARLTHDCDFPEGDEASTISCSKRSRWPAMTEEGVEAVGEMGWREGKVGEGGGGTEATVGWQSLVARVVGLDAEVVFFAVVGFL